MGLNQDLDNIKAIEDKLTANKVAKFAYTDHAYNNPLTEADGVQYYNVNNEQNIPVADPAIMNVNETVLTKGWRSQASSITRMLMNHFLGRVSYNLNKLNDNMSALLTTLRTNLSNVVNTGDSANASSGGTTKFTTGGAYNLLSSIAPYFSTSTTYAVGDLVTYQNRLYECTTAHSAGAWKANHFTARSVQYVISNYILPSFAPYFSTSTAYAVGAFVTYQNKLYRCKATHSAGAWNTSHFELATLNDINTSLGTKADLLDLAPAFSASTSYAVGDYVTYNGNMYRCTVAHSGAWNASDFTPVTVGSDLALKADKTSLAVPTDAVLHYSFDDVPDYPDGTADVRLIDNNTYDIQSTNYRFRNNSGTTFSNENGNLKCSITGGSSWTGCYISANAIQNKIVKIRIKVTDIVGTLDISVGVIASGNLKSITEKGVYDVVELHPTESRNNQLFFFCVGDGNSCTFTVEQIYIGNGSYATPIIDNANGQNNAVNNGGIATKGVSGKGLYFPNGNKNATINFPAPTSDDNFTISLWLNISTDYIANSGSIKPIIEIGSYAGTVGFVRQANNIILYNRDSISDKSYSTPMDKGKWHNYVGVYNGTGHRFYLYVDGVYIGRTNANTAGFQFGSNSTQWRIWGNDTIGGDSVDEISQPATLDDLLIFDRALTENEVMALYWSRGNTPKFYNINNYILDNSDSTPTQDSTNLVTSGGVYTELAKKVDTTTKVNGHSLASNVTVTKGDVGLGSVENTGDSATPVSGGTTKFTTGGAYTELNKKVDKTTKVNGHALSGNVTVTKGDVSLGNVVNTGDSAVPAENGTKKFTTGGAFDFFGGNTDANAWLGRVFGWALGRNWSQGQGAMTGYFYFVYYADGIWVAGSVNLGLWWSTDGKTWTQATGTTSTYTFFSVYYANGIWVAGSENHGLLWSTDRTTWTRGSGVTGYTFNFVYYANGIWVAGSVNHGLWWSTDGKTWTQATGTTSTYAFNFAYYANGIWVAGSDSHSLWWSTDGKTWTQGTGTVSNASFRSIYYANGTWVAGSLTLGLWWSTDGKTWTQVTGTTSTYTFFSVYYANGIWVAGSRLYGLWWSTDGKAWIQGQGSMLNYTFRSVYYANGIWVAGSDEGGLYWSTDGKAWIQGQGSMISYMFRSVYNANGIWVAGSNGHGIWCSDFTNADIQ